MPFEAPGSADYFQMKDHIGSLVLIAVNEYKVGVSTAAGVSDIIRGEIAVVDGPGVGGRYGDSMIFGKKLVPQLRNQIGKTVLGRIRQGKADVGKSAPYILEEATLADAELANQYVKANGDVESRPSTTPAPQVQPSYQRFQPDQPNGSWGQPPTQGGQAPFYPGPQQWTQPPAQQYPQGPPANEEAPF